MKKYWLKQIYHNHGDNHQKEVKTSIKKEKGFVIYSPPLKSQDYLILVLNQLLKIVTY